MQLRECHEDHLCLPHTGVGPTQLDHVWFTGLQAIFQSRVPSPLTHHLLHLVRRKKASKRTKQSTARDAYVVGWYRDGDWDPDSPGPSMPFVPLAALMFLLGDVFDGHRQQDDPTSVPLLTPHAGGGLSPPPIRVVHGRPAFDRACNAVGGREEWAIVLLLSSAPAPDAHESPVPEVVRMDNVPHDPYVAVTSPCDGGAAEQGTEVLYQPPRSTAIWGAKDTTALDAIKSICECDV